MDTRGWDHYDQRHRQPTGLSTLPPIVRTLGRAGDFRSILDVGCGDGGTLASILRSGGTYESVVGVEMSPARAARAAARATAAIGDAQALPVRSASFDVVVSRHVIEHVPDDQAMACEMLRVCRPGGFVYVETPLKRAGATYIYRSPTGERVLDPTHLREYRSVLELEHLFLQAGAVVVAAEVAKLSYPVGNLVSRALSLLGVSVPDNRFGGLSIPVPRYAEIRLLVERPGAVRALDDRSVASHESALPSA